MNTSLRLFRLRSFRLLGTLALVAWSTPALIQAAPKTPAKAPAKTPAKTPVKPRPTPTRPRPVPRVTPETTAPVVAPQPTATPVPVPTATPLPPAPTPTPTPPRSRTWALLIGISKYNNPQIASLRFPATDAAGIREALVDPQLGAVPANQIRMLTDEAATGANINKGVDEFLKPNVKSGDQVIVFLAGHGVAKGVGVDARSYLLPTDVKGLSSAALETSAVDLRKLSNKLGELPASQFVVFVDACREDPTPGRGVKGNQLSDVMSRSAIIIPQENRPASAVTFFACDVGQRAFEDARLKHGVFTYWILDAIREGAVPQKDGTIRMSELVSYVTDKVTQWAETTSRNGDFEVEQTPKPVTGSDLPSPVVLMRVKRTVADPPIAAKPAQLTIAALPEDAKITVDGKPIGVTYTVPRNSSGEVEIKVEKQGYEPVSRSVKVQDGIEFQLPVELQPNARSVSTPVSNTTTQMFHSAMEAESRMQWEGAMAGYNMIIQGDPNFLPAYERLANLQRRSGDLPAAIQTLINLVNNSKTNAHSHALLAEAYAKFWERAAAREGAEKNPPRRVALGRDYTVPVNSMQAAELARRAANEAVRLDANSAEAQRALGFALVAGDDKGRNKRDALGAFGKAVFLDAKDAANHFGLGYGIRFFASLDKEGAGRTAELKRAVASLKEAVALRADYYEAHRELAYVYYLMDDNDAALREGELANACRGDASDPDDFAGVNVTMAGIHQEEAQKSQGEKKQRHQAASEGYLNDAKETSGDRELKVALGFLRGAGLSTQLGSYLPSEFHRVMNFDPKAEIRNRVPSLPGGIRIPGF